MPQEIRRLVFSHNETTQALKKNEKNIKQKLPKGSILHARYALENEQFNDSKKITVEEIFKDYNVKPSEEQLIITFYNDKTLEHSYINVSSDEIVASLIQYCLDKKVMLPKNGSKTLDVVEFNLCLDIGMDIKVEEEESLELES